MKKNKITVFTITYNCATFVKRCYKSIILQNHSEWIWLVIDDGSKDETYDIIKSLNDSRIQYFKIENNIGRGSARNFGLSKVQTEWVAILDMDDLMLHSRLERFNNSINNGFDGLISSTLLVDKNLHISGIRNVIYNHYFNLFTHATLCIKTEFLKKVSYSESRYAEDQRVIILIINYYKIDQCIDPLYVYLEDASINVRGAFLSNYYAFKNLKEIIFSNYSYDFRKKYFLYLIKFGFNAFVLFFISKLSFGNQLYNKFIKQRVKHKLKNNLFEKELKIYG